MTSSGHGYGSREYGCVDTLRAGGGQFMTTRRSGGGCDNRERSCEALRHDLSSMASMRLTIEYPNTYASLASNYLRLRRITLLPT